ncbi:hypothetical protein [Actinomadura rudentiformis]|nr:hypothetical protein [Actinomadura rudentiformis]
MNSHLKEEIVPRSLKQLLAAADPGIPERRRRPRNVMTLRRVT